MMSNIDVKFIDATAWTEMFWYNSGGTRAKRVLQDPEGKEWYFKCSEKKPAKDGKPEKYYKYEFWGEIIAYQLGKQLGLDVLRYDVAVHDDTIGCISPLMINREEEQLIEVGRYMTSLNPDFLPEDHDTRTEYTFQLLKETLEYFGLSKYWSFFFKTILFDAVIGNTDRHQENWAFIGKSGLFAKGLKVIEDDIKLDANGFIKLRWIPKLITPLFYDKNKGIMTSTFQQAKIAYNTIVGTAPIYDSGSCLARELTNERIVTLLNNNQAFEKYVCKGLAEIHWNKNKISHFDLLTNLLESSYVEEVVKSADFFNKWQDEFIKKLIETIDEQLPENWRSYSIPEERKNFILKLLTLRSQKIKALINERV